MKLSGFILSMITFLCLLVFGSAVYGLVLAFKASILLGILVFAVEPTPLVLGVVAIFGHPEIAQKIAEFLNLPF